MKSITQYVIIVYSIVLFSCGKTEKREISINDDEYKVMEAVIDRYFISVRYSHDTLKLIRMYDHTIKGNIMKGNITGFISYSAIKKWRIDSLFTIKSCYPKLDWNYIDSSFNSANLEEIKLDSSQFHFAPKLSLLSDRHGDVKANRKTPSSTPIICFSRVGFNSNRDTALIFFSANLSSYAGGRNVLFAKDNNRWKIINDVYYWDGGID